MTSKRLEIFKEEKVLLPYDIEDRDTVAHLPAYREATRHLGIALVERPLRTYDEAQATIG